jgi:hypothetical protein
MLPGERKLRSVVIKDCARPLRRGVTRFTRLGKARRGVVRVGRLLEIGQVTTGAGEANARKLSADMATRACGRGMLARQRELRVRVVIEFGSQPLRRGVATLTSLWESGRHVIRIGGLLKIRQVAAGASGRQRRKLPANMTTCACG